MTNDRRKSYTYSGPLCQLIEMYVEKKRSEGLLFNKQAQMFARLDRLSIEMGAAENTLSKELVDAWATRQYNESAKNQSYRLNFIKLFAQYMQSQGYRAYYPDYSIGHAGTAAFVPHIFDKEELQRFFFSAEHMRRNGQYPDKNIVIPMLMRVLYCCGLRVSEALRLTVADVDLKRGLLLIQESKFGKSRTLPISDSLNEKLLVYSNCMHADSGADAVFFPNARKKKHHESEAYTFFRQILWEAKIPHGGKGKGPRLHDLRHTFAVHCLHRWVAAGVDINAAVPYLSAYLGHVDLSGTQKYLHLAAFAYPDVLDAVADYMGDTIPGLENE